MSKRLLIVDSNRHELKKLREIFSREGYCIMTATDEQSAAEISSNLEIDFVVAEPDYFKFRKIVKHPKSK